MNVWIHVDDPAQVNSQRNWLLRFRVTFVLTNVEIIVAIFIILHVTQALLRRLNSLLFKHKQVTRTNQLYYIHRLCRLGLSVS